MPDRPKKGHDERHDDERFEEQDDALDARLGRWLRSEALTPDERRRIVEHTMRGSSRLRVASPTIRRWGVHPAWWLVPAAAVLIAGVVLTREILREETPPRPVADRDRTVAGEPTVARNDRQPEPPRETPRAPVIGQVVDDHGLPLADGTVQAISTAGRALGQVSPIDATGQFMLHGTLGTMSTLLLVRGRRARRRPALVRYSPGSSPFNVALEPAAPVNGVTIDDESATPLDGVEVALSASWAGGQIDLERTVSLGGAFEVAPVAAAAPELAQLTYVARISRPGYVTQLRQFTDPSALERWLTTPRRLRPASAMTVDVRTTSGNSVSGAVVHLLPARPLAAGETFLYRAPDGARTDGVGRVRFTRIPRGPLRVRVAHPDSIATVDTRVRLDSAEIAVPVVLDLGGEIAGVVTDEAGRPIAGALAYAAPSWPGATEQFAPATGANETSTTDIVEGAIKDAIQGEVPFAFGPVMTDERGRFRLGGLPSGRYQARVYASTPDGASYVPAVATTRTGERSLALELAPSRVTLRLAVREAATARAVSAFAVVLLGPGGRVIRRPTRAGDGWIVDQIDPATTAVQVLAAGYLPSRLARIDAVSAKRGEPSMRLAQIDLDRPARLSGRVIGPYGHPVSGVVITRSVDDYAPIRPDARALHAAGHARRTATGLDGRFVLDGLDVRESTRPNADPFWLRVERPNGTAIRYEIPGLQPGQRMEELTIVVP